MSDGNELPVNIGPVYFGDGRSQCIHCGATGHFDATGKIDQPVQHAADCAYVVFWVGIGPPSDNAPMLQQPTDDNPELGGARNCPACGSEKLIHHLSIVDDFHIQKRAYECADCYHFEVITVGED